MFITISRELGSRGEDLGQAVAQELGLPYYDHEIFTRAARLANVSVRTIEQAERVPSLLTRMIEALGRYPAGFEVAEATPPIGAAPPLASDAYRALIERVIVELARGPGGVIVGHAAALVLRGAPDTLHLRVCAAFEDRVRTVAAAEALALEDARRRVRQADQTRVDYVQRYYQANWRDAATYDLTINLSRMRFGVAVATAIGLVRLRRG